MAEHITKMYQARKVDREDKAKVAEFMARPRNFRMAGIGEAANPKCPVKFMMPVVVDRKAHVGTTSVTLENNQKYLLSYNMYPVLSVHRGYWGEGTARVIFRAKKSQIFVAHYPDSLLKFFEK